MFVPGMTDEALLFTEVPLSANKIYDACQSHAHFLSVTHTQQVSQRRAR